MNKSKFGKTLRKCADQASYVQKLVTKVHAIKQTANLPIDTGGLLDSVTDVCERLAFAIARYKELKADAKADAKAQAQAKARADAEKLVRASQVQAMHSYEPNAGDITLLDDGVPFQKKRKPATKKAEKKGRR